MMQIEERETLYNVIWRAGKARDIVVAKRLEKIEAYCFIADRKSPEQYRLEEVRYDDYILNKYEKDRNIL